MKKFNVKLFLSILMLIGMVQGGQSNNIQAVEVIKTANHDYYSVVGLHVGTVTLNAHGDVDMYMGQVYTMWMTDWTWWPNYVKDRQTWLSNYPGGQRANAQYTIGVGINTKWVEAILKSRTDYLFLAF
jgi:hypothetical protein